MHKNGNMRNGFRGKMMKFKTIIIQEAMEEIRGGKSQSLPMKGWKRNNFFNIFLRRALALGRTPAYQISRLQQTLGNKILKIFGGTLTEGLARWNFLTTVCGFLRLWFTHPECHESLQILGGSGKEKIRVKERNQKGCRSNPRSIRLRRKLGFLKTQIQNGLNLNVWLNNQQTDETGFVFGR